jgi:hypothetical protein
LLLSNLFLKRKIPGPHFAPGLFLALLALFVLMGQARPVVGLVGIGTTAVLAAVLVELNRNRIWEEYRKAYRRQKGLKGVLAEPHIVYYNINVYLLWPFILFLGTVCLWTAYMLG